MPGSASANYADTIIVKAHLANTQSYFRALSGPL